MSATSKHWSRWSVDDQAAAYVELKRLAAVQLASARFRSAVIGSGALNHVSQDKYMDELRALEQALAATPPLPPPVDGAAS